MPSFSPEQTELMEVLEPYCAFWRETMLMCFSIAKGDDESHDAEALGALRFCSKLSQSQIDELPEAERTTQAWLVINTRNVLDQARSLMSECDPPDSQ